MSLVEWEAGEPCELHDLGWCSLCKLHPSFPKNVYMTTGWSAAFHRHTSCKALTSGQNKVAAHGGDPADVILVPVNKAITDGKFPCQICWPQFGGTVPASN
jgi:hypothetical protein